MNLGLPCIKLNNKRRYELNTHIVFYLGKGDDFIESKSIVLNTEELNPWREEIRILKECRKELSGSELSHAYHAQRPHFQNYVNSVVQKFGAERVNTVLGYTVRHFDYDGRFDRSVKNWAQTQPRAPQPPRMKHNGNEPPRDFHELISDTHPVILNFVCHFQMEAAQEKQKSHKKIDRGESR